VATFIGGMQIDQSATSAAGTGQQGATLGTQYYDRTMGAVPVTIDELIDLKSGSIGEFNQFIFGEFLLAGAFWLGIERWWTTPDVWSDVLFWVCLVLFGAGALIMYFGFLQLKRRKDRMDRIIASAKLRAPQVHVTRTVTSGNPST
jgi:hypothetical protein